MRKQMIENAAFDVATQVRAVEDAIETALASGGQEAAFIARVLLAAEPAVSVGLDTAMRAMLENIRDST